MARVGDPDIVLRRVPKLEVGDRATRQSYDAEEDWTEYVYVFSVKVVPYLAITIQSTTTIDVNILTTKLEEGCCILEDLFEGICLPVVCVVGEENIPTDIKIDMREEGKIKGSTNQVIGALVEDDMATMVAFVDSIEDVLRIIRDQIVVTVDVACLLPRGLACQDDRC